MELNEKNIEQYIGRFMAGETTNEEEAAIYRYFRTAARLPERLRGYAPMFAWYEAGMPGEPEDFPAGRAEAVSLRKRGPSRFLPAAWTAGVAAMLVIALGLGALYYAGRQADSGPMTEWECYEGSYVMVNGRRIADLRQIMPFLLAEQEAVERKMEDVDAYLCEMKAKERRVEELMENLKTMDK